MDILNSGLDVGAFCTPAPFQLVPSQVLPMLFNKLEKGVEAGSSKKILSTTSIFNLPSVFETPVPLTALAAVLAIAP